MRAVGFGGTGAHGWLGSLRWTLGVGSTVQFLSALAGFASLPIIIGHLGSAEFGILVVITSLAPWLTLLDGAIQPATRLLVGESRGRGSARASRSLLGSSLRFALVVAATNAGILALSLAVLPIMRWFGAVGVVDFRTLATSIAAFCIVIIASGPGGVFLGALEGVGRGVAASAIAGSGPLAALPLTVFAAERGSGLLEFCAIQGFSVALPRYLAWIYWHWRPSLLSSSPSSPTSGALRVALVVQIGLLGAMNLVQSGLDPLIVSSYLGADAAAEFGLALRLAAGALVPLAILAPLVGSNIAAARGGGWDPERNRDLRRLVGFAGVVGAGVGLSLVLLGPPLAQLLGQGEVGAPRSLYLASGLFVSLTYVSQPLYLAFQGPRGIRFSVSMNVVLAVGNLGVSLVLVRSLGVSGPMWASAGAGLLAVTSWLLVWRRHPEWLSDVHVAH